MEIENSPILAAEQSNGAAYSALMAKMKLAVKPSNEKIYFSVDCVIFGLSPQGLQVLLIKHGYEPAKGKWALPGGLLEIAETIEEATGRILKVLTGVSDVYTEQFFTFSDLYRYPGLRIITTGVYAMVSPELYQLEPSWYASEAQWFPVSELPEMAFDHNKIFSRAFSQLQHDVRIKPIGFHLLPEKFTLSQLQFLFESVLQVKMDRRNFRRKILSLEILSLLEEKQEGVHAPAHLYTFDEKKVAKASKEGYSFRI
jgi:8-oxo-dGTP diphosphatase